MPVFVYSFYTKKVLVKLKKKIMIVNLYTEFIQEHSNMPLILCLPYQVSPHT